MPPILSDKFQEAFAWAASIHSGQKRKGTEIPYVSHLLAVAAIVLEAGGDEDEAIAALLHDAVEDAGGAQARREIGRRFGTRVLEIVEGCTDTDQIPKPPWKKRKTAYLADLRTASPSVRLVEAADKLHNARAILADFRALGDRLWERFNAPAADILWYYRSMADVLAAAGPSPLLEELDRVVTELERLAASQWIRA